jgi:uncharacterized protein (TIGR03437 family)
MSRINLSMLSVLAGFLGASAGLHARSIGPLAAYTGAPMDFAGRNCTACHQTFAPANSDARGRITLQAVNYRPGVKQTIKVRVAHPEGARWGFQLTARSLNNPSIAAGTFTVSQGLLVRCLDGTSSPCNNNPEFASQDASSTQVGKPDFGEWDVEWTPPASEVGAIVLYAAGNAANNNGTNAGDRIYTTSLELRAEGACNLTARPNVRSIGNAGSYATTLATNSLATLFGLNFQTPGLTREAGPGDLVNNAFPKELACVAIEVDGQRAPITYVQTDQVNFQVPTTVKTGSLPVRVILNPDKPNQVVSDVVNMTMAEYGPGFFTFDGKSIKARTTDYAILADPSVVPGGVKAKPGDVVLLYGTGFNVTSPVWQAGEITAGLAQLNPSSLRVTIGGTMLASSDILYAGLAPGSISGLYQFNVRIPSTAPNGDVPVSISIGGVSTQSGTTIPVQR